MIKVAGVKYDNDIADGGENRQDILKSFMDEGRSIITVELIYYPKNNGLFGVKLREKESGKIIGWMHTETADSVSKTGITHMTGFIGYHGSYHVKLDDVKKPNDDDYNLVKSICDMKGIHYPAYDARALELDIYK